MWIEGVNRPFIILRPSDSSKTETKYLLVQVTSQEMASYVGKACSAPL